jgi:hypothetical protein
MQASQDQRVKRIIIIVQLGGRFLANAILRYQLLRVGILLGHAGGSDGFALLSFGGDLLLQGEKLGEQNLFDAGAIGGGGRLINCKTHFCGSSLAE